MVLPAYVIDADTHETIAKFGYEPPPLPVGAEPEYYPARWAIARSYRIPAVGPGGHPWMDWCGAILILGSVAGVIGRAL